MTKTDLILGGGIVGTGTIVLLFIAPVETLIVIAVALGVGGVTLAFLQWFGVLGPLYVQTTLAAQKQPQKQPLLLGDARHNFVAAIQRQIGRLPMAATDKQRLHSFTMRADATFEKLVRSEGVPVFLVGVRFGALTVTFRLRLREFSRSNLNNLMKLDSLIAQALSVETVRLVPGAGWIGRASGGTETGGRTISMGSAKTGSGGGCRGCTGGKVGRLAQWGTLSGGETVCSPESRV